MPRSQHRIVEADLVAPDVYARERAERRKALIPIKRRRRVEVGPYATFYFENYDTMLAQVHEMLHIEKGGKEQIPGEIEAYNPLIPQGSELIATLMLEIDEPNRRTAALMKLAGIEESAYLQIGSETIEGKPTEYGDRTSDDGKTSSVHWVRFPFTKAQIAAFRTATGTVILGAAHPQYGHMAVMPADVREELAKDFD
jgi:Protein of unknown function (DUF3501)